MVISQEYRDERFVLQKSHVPRRCPFCNSSELRIVIGEGWIFDADIDSFVSDYSHDDVFQVFCYECEEEILRSDIRDG